MRSCFETDERIVADLGTGSHIAKIREGRRLRYPINADLCLHHEMLQDKAAGDLLDVFGWTRRRRQIQRRELLALAQRGT